MASRIFTPKGFIKSDFHIESFGRTGSIGRLNAIIVLNTKLIDRLDALEKIKEHYELDMEDMFSISRSGRLDGTWVYKEFRADETKAEVQKQTKNLAEILGLGHVPFKFDLDIPGPYSISYQNELLTWLDTFESYINNERLSIPSKIIFAGSYEDFKEVAELYGFVKE